MDCYHLQERARGRHTKQLDDNHVASMEAIRVEAEAVEAKLKLDEKQKVSP